MSALAIVRGEAPDAVWSPPSPSSGPVGSMAGAVAQDELGFLWADGNAAPKYRLPNDADASSGALVCWTERGLGLWVHPKSLAYLRDISRLDDVDRWIPVATVLPNLPGFVTTPSVPA